LKDVSNWFHSHSDEAQTKDFVQKRTSLECVTFILSISSDKQRWPVSFRALERPIVHRITEVEEFPQALNISQMWNWHTRLFLSEARENLTAEEQAGTTGRYTKTELEELEKTLKEHETWLNEWVEKRKKTPVNHDPVVETAEMRTRAKTLETHLQRLVQKKPPRVRPNSSSTATQVPLPTDNTRSGEGQSDGGSSKHDEL
jgi:hypoxia up-regulated 1